MINNTGCPKKMHPRLFEISPATNMLMAYAYLI